MPDTNPVPIKYIRTATMPKTPIGGKTDVFSVTDDGLAPKAPTSYTPSAGEKMPDFGRMNAGKGNSYDAVNEGCYECSYDHNSGLVTIEKIKATNGNDAIFTGLTRGRFQSGYLKRNGMLMIGAQQGGCVAYKPRSGACCTYFDASWSNDITGFPTVPSSTPFDIEVTATTLTVKYGSTTETADLSQFNIIYPTLGYGSVTTTLGSLEFTNLDAGSGTETPDTTKFLRSDAEWDVPPMDASKFSSAFKTALLNCFRNVSWIDDDGSQFVNALSALLYSDEVHDGWANGVAYQNIGTVSGEKISSSNGTFTSASGWTRTVFVPCEGASRIVFPQLNETALQGDNAAFYNRARQRVSVLVLGLSAPKEVSVPNSAAYFAISSEDAALASCISEGIVPYA